MQTPIAIPERLFEPAPVHLSDPLEVDLSTDLGDNINLAERMYHLSVEHEKNFLSLEIDKNNKDNIIVDVNNFERMKARLEALLETSVQSLKNDPSPANHERVSLLLIESVSALVAQNITVPAVPTSSGVRQTIFTVYDRLAKLLGRNSTEAVKEDTRARLLSLGEEISFRPGVGNKQKVNPSDHIKNVIIPKLDSDMVPYAYYQNMYLFQAMKNFHTLIGMWRSRGEDLGLIKSTK